ncbi:MAG: carboxypeptidase regulatory-like domain-containing protein [Gemmatimonadaceae bacterium]|nr:carboxypeptidase regulatory-like domain-containing protein [Gemmatimonadaceae bacterium]
MHPVPQIVRTLRAAAVFLALGCAVSNHAGAQAVPARPVAATATIAGVVVDSGGAPVSGAVVRHVSGEPHLETGPDGAFRLAGLVPGRVSVEVLHPGFRLLAFEFDIAAGVTASLRLTLTPAPSAAAPAAPPETRDSAVVPAAVDSQQPVSGPPLPPRRGGLTGAIVDSSGRRVFGAVINAISTPLTASSDSSGRFRLAPLEGGLQFIRVRKVGYLAEYLPVTIVEGRLASITVKLRPAGQTLARVEVRADARSAAMAGFDDRARTANGIFIRRSELLARNASNVTDVLRGRNGITLFRNSDGNQVAYGRGLTTSIQGCPMGLIIDGTPMVTGRSGLSFSIDQFVNVQDIRAMEVYRSGQSVPAEFQRPETDCGAIIVWTR